MNPQLLLTLWRQRWGKSVGNALVTPYLEGQISLWGSRLTQGSAWSLPLVVFLTSLSCILLFAFLLSVRFTLNGQIVFSVSLVCASLYARRYAGRFVTLVLMGLAFIVSARYLYWRFSATLAQDINSDFVLGFSLCIAEVHLWLLMILNSLQAIWPLKQTRITLPSESAGWPTVDILIPCQGQPACAIKSAATAALALDWPKNKLKIYILDDSPRDDIKALADSLGSTYLAHPGNSDGKAGNINQALPNTEGELVAIFDCDRTPGNDFLRTTVGWFVQDAKLGMLQTPQHFLAPAPPECSLEILNGFDSAGSCAVLRRSMLVEVGGVEVEPVTRRAHTALKLQARGYGTAYVGLAERTGQPVEKLTMSIERQAQFSQQAFRVDQPFGDKSLRWKLRMASLKAMLEFYYPVPRLIFFSAPLVYLLFDVGIIQSSAELFIAYALPHLVQGHIARERMQEKHRFTLWTDVRETLLAWYLLLLTTMTLIRTELARCKNHFKFGKAQRHAALDWKLTLPYVILFGLNLTGLIVGITRLRLPSTPEQEIVVLLFLLWVVYNQTILSATLAVAEESREIRRYTRLQSRLPAMIRLPSGRTVSCMTENFPETSLALKLPTPMAIENGLTVDISIFHDNHEFSFPARVVLDQDWVLRASIDGPAQNVYRALGVAAYSRGQDWPKWLPSGDADHPVPRWINKTLFVMRRAALNWAMEVDKFARWSRFPGGMQIWKKRK